MSVPYGVLWLVCVCAVVWLVLVCLASAPAPMGAIVLCLCLLRVCMCMACLCTVCRTSLHGRVWCVHMLAVWCLCAMPCTVPCPLCGRCMWLVVVRTMPPRPVLWCPPCLARTCHPPCPVPPTVPLPAGCPACPRRSPYVPACAPCSACGPYCPTCPSSAVAVWLSYQSIGAFAKAQNRVPLSCLLPVASSGTPQCLHFTGSSPGGILVPRSRRQGRS